MKYRYREPHEMKDSGVEWLGMIPKEWEVSKLKYNYNFEKGKNAALFTKEYIEMNKGKFPVYSGQTENDGIMGKISSYEYNLEKCIFTTTVGAKVMTPMLLTGKFSLSQNCLIMRNKVEINNSFIYYQLFPLFDYQKSMIPTHMQPSLRIEDLNKFDIFLPTIIIQQKIADFLDKKCEEFDSVIAKKEMLINKLEEAKKSLISEVVTGKVKVIQKENGEYGIIKREAHEMKDSGVEWLGMIPKEWKVSRLKYLFKITKRIAGKEGYSVLSITQKGIRIKDITSGSGQLSMDYSKYQIVNYGDFAMNHMDLLTGYVDISKFSGVTSPDYRVFNLRNKENIPEYLLLLLQLGYRNKIFFRFGQGSSQLGRWRFPTDQFYDFIFPIPSKEEQNIVSKCIFYKIKNIDKIIEKQKESIEKLKSAKQSLISEVVTGKIEIL